MRLSKYASASPTAMTTLLITAVAVGITSLLGHSSSANSAEAIIELKVKYVAPPCNVEMPKQVFLGSILPGTASYAPFSLQISCPDPTSKAAVYGVAVGSTMATASRLNMNNTNGASGTPAQMWFTEGGKPDEIKLGADGATDVAKQFCNGTGLHQTCTLTPWTQATVDTPKGETTATVTFTVIVP